MLRVGLARILRPPLRFASGTLFMANLPNYGRRRCAHPLQGQVMLLLWWASKSNATPGLLK